MEVLELLHLQQRISNMSAKRHIRGIGTLAKVVSVIKPKTLTGTDAYMSWHVCVRHGWDPRMFERYAPLPRIIERFYSTSSTLPPLEELAAAQHWPVLPSR
jgi:hypothetical protein